MDKLKAIELEKELKGTVLNGYEILKLINNGKSAAVFKAKKDNDFFALKIFDNELVERFGHEIQTKRIEQEIALKNHKIDNLVKIHEGGNTTVGSQTFYFIIMGLISGVNIKDYIKTKTYGQDFIIKVLEKLTLTTEQLLTQKQIAHRDIKPENIMVDDDGNIILMDMGVLKLIGAKSFSDEEEKSFVGTLRYAPPEFLLRTEENSVKGWRAINVYQIGATLHDLVMKKELFNDKTPYTNLVIAIKEDTPKVSNPDIAFELLQLTRDMMTKDWKKRLELVTIERLQKALVIKDKLENPFDQGIEDILKMRLGHQSKFDEIEKLRRTKDEIRKKQKEFAINLSIEINKCFDSIKNKGVCNSIKKSENFLFDRDRSRTDVVTQNYLYELVGELKIGFPRSLYILARMSNDESNYTEIELYGIFPSSFLKANVNSPQGLFQELFKERQRFNPYDAYQTIKTINIFKGNVDFDDSFNIYIRTQIVKLISKALKMVEKEVQEELQLYEDLTNSKQAVHSRVTSGRKNIVIDSL
jgi:serine/threonine protein kinase